MQKIDTAVRWARQNKEKNAESRKMKIYVNCKKWGRKEIKRVLKAKRKDNCEEGEDEENKDDEKM